jgi:hypothetical protein
LKHNSGADTDAKSGAIIMGGLKIRRKSLFLVDASGALLTALVLFITGEVDHNFFGMPQAVMKGLATIAVILCVYSTLCFFALSNTVRPFLRAIAMANLSYCCLTAVLLVYHFTLITLAGLIYFIAEMLVIVVLASVEWRASQFSA